MLLADTDLSPEPISKITPAGKPDRSRVASGNAAPGSPRARGGSPGGSASNSGATDPHDEGEETTDGELLIRGAPAWLVSLVVHLSIIVGLALIAGARPLIEKGVEIFGQRAEGEDFDPENQLFAEKLGDQLAVENPLSIPGETPVDADHQIVTPQNLPRVDNALAAPSIATIGATGAAGAIEAPEIGWALNGRQAGSMKNILLKAYGGTATTEAAVKRGLEWLAKNQGRDGSWSLTGPYSNGGSAENRAAATGLALIAFQGDGHTHEKGEYSKHVARGWNYLIKLQDRDGNFFQTGVSHHRLYTQAICSIALCELYGMTHDSHFREPAERAVKYAVRIQDKEGGWRYTPGDDSDTSVTGWFVMALQSARMAQIDVPSETLYRVSEFLDKVQLSGGRGYGYQVGRGGSPAMTAEGLLCRQYLGWKRTDARLIDGAASLIAQKVDYRREPDVYYWYYATQVAHHMEGEVWKEWNATMRQQIPAHQTTKGPEAGSWDPTADTWGSTGGRLYVTCLSIFNLEVYYRHLPIYSGRTFSVLGDK